MVLPVLRVLVSMTMPRVVVVVVVVIVVLVLACGRDARFFALARRYQTPPAAKASKEGGIFFFGLPFLLLLLLPLFDFFVIIFERERKTRDGPVFFLFFFSAFWRRMEEKFLSSTKLLLFRAFLLCIFRTTRVREEKKRRRRNTRESRQQKRQKRLWRTDEWHRGRTRRRMFALSRSSANRDGVSGAVASSSSASRKAKKQRRPREQQQQRRRRCHRHREEKNEGKAADGNTSNRRTAMLGAVTMATAAAVMTETPRRAEAAMTSSVPKTAKKSLRNVVELTPENFKDYISADAKKPTSNVFVEFYAPWCPFCQKLEPIWNELPNELRKYGNETTVARMNVDKYTDYARAYGVSGFPTLMLFEAGKPVGAKTGLIDMQTALKYAGVSQEKLGLLAVPNKALDIVLTKDQVENARKELDVVRKEVSTGLVGESRNKALSALNVVDGVFVSQL